MRIGLSSPLAHETPAQWAEQMQRLCCRCVVFPADQYNPDMPMIIEHLSSDREYLDSLEYVRRRLQKAGFAV